MVAKTKKNNHCLICETRPAIQGPYCANCASKIEAERKSRNGAKPAKYLTYRGIVVGLYPNGSDGTYKPVLLKRNPDHLPKSKTLNLNTYLDGFTREQIKKFKRAILSLAHA